MAVAREMEEVIDTCLNDALKAIDIQTISKPITANSIGRRSFFMATCSENAFEIKSRHSINDCRFKIENAVAHRPAMIVDAAQFIIAGLVGQRQAASGAGEDGSPSVPPV